MQAGRFKALVKDKVVSENKKGNPQVEIQLEVEFGPDDTKTMNYYGQLTGKALEHTLKALVASGVKGNSIMDPITINQEVSVVIDEDVDDDGKARFKVSWINKPATLGTPIDETRGRAALQKYEGALAALRAKEAKLKNHAPGASAPSFDSNEEIPF